MRKLLFALPVVGFAAASFADPAAPGLTDQLASAATDGISSLSTAVGPILIAAFGIAVAFVAYKLIKRAIGKA